MIPWITQKKSIHSSNNPAINVPFYIAKRYLRHTRKQRNLVHLITRISVIGIAVTTMALVVLVAAFNGIEGMVERLYSDFDAPVTVRSAHGKTFPESNADTNRLKRIEGVARISRAVEETVILKHRKKWTNAQMIGVDANYLITTHMNAHMVDGTNGIGTAENPQGLIGAVLLDKIEASVQTLDGYALLTIYTPLREISVSKRKNPFKTDEIKVTGRMNFNREVNSEIILVPLDYARTQLKYDNEITALYIGLKPGADAFEVKESVQHALGSDFSVKTAAEKNELIFKTSQSEKRIVIIILGFVFVLAAFNLIASLTMLFLEKRDNIRTMSHYGASRTFVFRIFFFEGLLIAGKGILIGIALGSAICIAQYYGHFLEMPNSGGEAFPIEFTVGDGVLIIVLVSVLSAITSFLPVYYMVKRAIPN